MEKDFVYYLKRYLKILLIFVPFIIGTMGFLKENMSLSDATFKSFLMYFAGYEDGAPNLMVQLARWSAPFVTASGILLVFVKWGINLRNFKRNLFQDTIVIYGENDKTEYIKKEVGKDLVVSEDGEFVKAKRYILFDDDEEKNMLFYMKYKDALKDKKVCLRCTDIKSQELVGNNVSPFNVEESASHLFWRQCGMYPLAKAHNFNLQVSIVGFNKLGQEILLKGLQDNIFLSSQKITYHVFGDAHVFKNMYHQLDQISDPVYFYEDWLDNISVLNESDMIIVCEQEDQMKLVNRLLYTISYKNLHVLTSETDLYSLFSESNRLKIFNWEEEVLKKEYLFSDELYRRAKEINLHYEKLYGNASATLDSAWEGLNAFTKYSNISSADYHDVRLEMLADWNVPRDFKALSAEQLDRLAELEHIRWCRYHYLSNWKYGIPANGKNKDPQLRIHKDLQSFRPLDDKEKQKDRDTIEILMKFE